MLVGPPLDHWHTEDLNAIFADIGKVLLWGRDTDHKGRIIAKIRVTDLADIPKSVRFTIGDLVETESWTFSVEVLQSHLLGGGPPEEDPLPDDNVDPHPVPAHGTVFGPQVPPPPPPPAPGGDWGQWMAPVQNPAPDGGNAEGWGPWEAAAAPIQGPVIAPGEDMPIDNQHLPPQDVNSGVTGVIVQDWESDDDESVNEPEVVEELGVAAAPQGVGIGE